MYRLILAILFTPLIVFGNNYPDSLLPEYIHHNLTVKDQGSDPTCWAYAFVGAAELVVSRHEGANACVRFNEQTLINWYAQAHTNPLPVDEVAFRGPQIESILWRIWTLGIVGSNGVRYFNLLIDLPPGYVPLEKRTFFTSPFVTTLPATRNAAMHKSGWYGGDFMWFRQQIHKGNPVVCAINIDEGHTMVALNIDQDNGVLFRNSWGDEMPIDLGPDTISSFMTVEYSVRLGTDAERLQQIALFKKAAIACAIPKKPFSPEQIEQLKAAFPPATK